MKKHTPNRVLVVGATSGLGRGIAETYISRGCVVGIAARRQQLLAEVAAGHPDVYTAVCDVTQPEACVEQLKALVMQMGGMDLLVLSSGVGNQNVVLSYEAERPMIETNVVGWTAIVDWAYTYFKEQGFGHLAAISSIAGVRGLAPAPVYSASKAFQSHYLEAIRQRAMRTGGRLCVTDIRPGFVLTPLLANPKQFFWVLKPEKAVRSIVRAIDRRKGVATITTRWAMLVPIMRILPNWLMALVLVKKDKM